MKRVSVIGSGTMGNGIAQEFARHGHRVSLVDISDEALDRAIKTIGRNLDRMIARKLITGETKERTLGNIALFSDLSEGVGDAVLVVEAATESAELKLSLFRQLDALCPPDAVLASNTSSISISKLAAVTGRAEKVVGMHFMNPVPVMKLVEVIRGYSTSEQTCAAVSGLARDLGKVPVEAADYPGFIANRILMPMINEAIYTLQEGVAGVAEIDTVMKLGMAHPMGPLQLADFIGLDVCLAILNTLYEGFGNPKYAPCPLLVNMVTAGQLGVKTGTGFYSHKPGSKELTVAGKFTLTLKR